jgi:dolichol-phosphate mannosyltransferase
MSLMQDRRSSVRNGSVSLILPQTPGSNLTDHVVAEYRRILEDGAGFRSVEVIIASAHNDKVTNGQIDDSACGDQTSHQATHVRADATDWPGLVRAGLAAAAGEHLVVLDTSRHYSPESLLGVITPVRMAEFDLAIAVPRGGGPSLGSRLRSRLGPGLISRMLLGTSDVFSGLFALRRVVWDSHIKHRPAHESSLVLDSLLRRQARCIDVAVTVDIRFEAGRIGFRDVRPVKRILDARFGNYSRLVQFCIVGASGMVIDLSSYALLQFLLSRTWLAQRQSALLGSTLHMAVAAGLSIAIALVWNFALNRRLTFNDSRRGALVRQFFTYVLSNALAIALSFSMRLWLPAHVGFFARHRLAAAVVGIVAATGVSFTMARWLVFSRRPELALATHFPLEQSTVDPTTDFADSGPDTARPHATVS